MGELAVEEQGEGDLVVFVHGIFDRGASFRKVTARLDGVGRMVTYDRRGYAGSLHAGPPVGVLGHAEDLLGVLAGRRAVLVGHSFGGAVVLGVAASLAPELARAVVLYESSVPWMPWFPRMDIDTTIHEPGADEAMLAGIMGERMAAMSPERHDVLRTEAEAMVAEQRSIRTGVAPYDLTAVTAPVVTGYDPEGFHAPVAPHLAETFAQVELVAVPGAGHNAHVSRPEAFAAMVRRALELAT